jgi:hypothetical protein
VNLNERKVWKILYAMLIMGYGGAAIMLWMVWHSIQVAFLNH